MKKWLTACLAWWLVATPAGAEDNTAPEFLLGDIGVRIDLPKEWKMTRWSDWDFKGEKGDVLLFAWATPVQTPIRDEDIDEWGPIYTAKVEELQGKFPSVKDLRVENIGTRPTAYADINFQFGSGGGGVLYGSTIAAGGQMFHMAFVTADRRAKAAEKARDNIMRRLDVQAKGEPLEVTPNEQVESLGATTKLPDLWRRPFKSEMGLAMKAIKGFGLEDISDCWVAIRPRPAVDPDVMVSCQGGLLLGVVDEYSFEGVDALVRSKMFGSAEVPGAARIDLPDRVGFQYKPPLGSRTLGVGVVPYDRGVARTWAVGQAGDDSVHEAVQQVVAASSYSGPHPASLGDRISYYLTYRPTSPMVLGPILLGLLMVGVLVIGVGLLLLRGRGRNKYADLSDD